MEKIIIPNETLPSWNKFYAGMHWGKRKEIADYWHKLVWAYVKEQKIPKMKYNGRSVTIHTTCYFSSKKKALDADNICDKLSNDGLKGIVLEDDDWKHVKSATTESQVDRENPRTEILISYV